MTMHNFRGYGLTICVHCLVGQERECHFSTLGQQEDHEENSQIGTQSITGKNCPPRCEGSRESSPERR